MLVTNVRQQRAIGRAAAAAGGYFQLARCLSQAQTERTRREGTAVDAPQAVTNNETTRR